MFGEQDHSVGLEKVEVKKTKKVEVDKTEEMELPESAQNLINWLNEEKVSSVDELKGSSEDKARKFNNMFSQAERDVIKLGGLTRAIFFAEQVPFSEDQTRNLIERYIQSCPVEHFREIGLILGHLRDVGMGEEEVDWCMDGMIHDFVVEQLSSIGRESFMTSLEDEEKENADDELVYKVILSKINSLDLIKRALAPNRAYLTDSLKKGRIYQAMMQRRALGVSFKEDLQHFDFRGITESYIDYLDFKAVYDFLTFFSKDDVGSEDYFKTIFNSDELQKLLSEQGKEADAEGMHYFIKCMELVGESVPEYIKADIEKHWSDELAERERMDKKREMYGEINVSYELVRFYVLQYLNLAILLSKSEMERFDWGGGELKIRDAVFLRDKEQYFNKQVEQAFDWISKYLVVAVNSELKNQYSLNHGFLAEVALPIEFENVESFVEGATKNQIRQYLKRASINFGQKGWTGLVGGKTWAKIAGLASDAWGGGKYDRSKSTHFRYGISFATQYRLCV